MNFRTAISRKVIARITSSSIALSVLALPVAAEVICNPQADHTNVRQGPSAKNFEIAGVLQNGDAITVLEHVTNSDGYPWIKIEAPGLQDTYVGYVTDGTVARSCDSVQAGVRPPYGMCFYVMAARQSTAEVQEYIRDFDQRTNGQFEADWAVAKSENGWYAITIGPVETDDFDTTKERLRSGGLSPDDAYCSDGKKYVEFVDIQPPATETAVTETSSEDVDPAMIMAGIYEEKLKDNFPPLAQSWDFVGQYDSTSDEDIKVHVSTKAELSKADPAGEEWCDVQFSVSVDQRSTTEDTSVIRKDFKARFSLERVGLDVDSSPQKSTAFKSDGAGLSLNPDYFDDVECTKTLFLGDGITDSSDCSPSDGESPYILLFSDDAAQRLATSGQDFFISCHVSGLLLRSMGN